MRLVRSSSCRRSRSFIGKEPTGLNTCRAVQVFWTKSDMTTPRNPKGTNRREIVTSNQSPVLPASSSGTPAATKESNKESKQAKSPAQVRGQGVLTSKWRRGRLLTSGDLRFRRPETSVTSPGGRRWLLQRGDKRKGTFLDARGHNSTKAT